MSEQFEKMAQLGKLDALNDALARESTAHVNVKALLEGLHPAEIALLLESLPAASRDIVLGAARTRATSRGLCRGRGRGTCPPDAPGGAGGSRHHRASGR